MLYAQQHLQAQQVQAQGWATGVPAVVPQPQLQSPWQQRHKVVLDRRCLRMQRESAKRYRPENLRVGQEPTQPSIYAMHALVIGFSAAAAAEGVALFIAYGVQVRSFLIMTTW